MLTGAGPILVVEVGLNPFRCDLPIPNHGGFHLKLLLFYFSSWFTFQSRGNRLVHVLWCDILGRYFGMILRYFWMKNYHDFLFLTEKKNCHGPRRSFFT